MADGGVRRRRPCATDAGTASAPSDLGIADSSVVSPPLAIPVLQALGISIGRPSRVDAICMVVLTVASFVLGVYLVVLVLAELRSEDGSFYKIFPFWGFQRR